MTKATEYVYEMEDGSGYVGRHPQGPGTIVFHPGDELDWDKLKSLGLKDVTDHTDYDQILTDAKAAGAGITEEDPEWPNSPTRIRSVGGPAEEDIIEVPHPTDPKATLLATRAGDDDQ